MSNEPQKPKRNPTKPQKLTLELRHFNEPFIAPQKAKPGSIGYDLTVPCDVEIPAHSRIAMPLNFAINLPYGMEAKIEPRSGLSIHGMEGYGKKTTWGRKWGIILWKHTTYGKQHFDADVLVGKIDPGYNDNIHVIIKNNDVGFLIRKGTRIAQLTFYRTTSPLFEVVEKFTRFVDRGGGLGSSGTQSLVREPGKKTSFNEYYAGLSPEKRAEIDGTPLGKVHNGHKKS